MGNNTRRDRLSQNPLTPQHAMRALVGDDSRRVLELEAKLESALQVSEDRWRFRRFEMTNTELIAPDKLTKEEADELGMMLSGMNTSAGFWLGDWVNLYIHPDMDNMAISAVYVELSERFRIKRGVLKNYASVCRKLPSSYRYDGLSFSHHIEVAKVPERARELLERAAVEQWSILRLRDEVRRDMSTRSKPKRMSYPRMIRTIADIQYSAKRLNADKRHQMAAALRALAEELEQ